MKIQKRELYAALTQINKTINPKASLQIIRTAKLTVHDGKLSIEGSDCSNFLKAEFHCTDDDIECCISVIPLLKLVKPEGKTDDSFVTISRDGNKLIVESEGIATKMPCLQTEGFPEPKDGDWELIAIWPSGEFLNNLKWVAKAASDDRTRPYICSVLIDGTFIVATNGLQLHKAPVPLPVQSEMLLSIDTVNLLLNILKLSEQVFIAKAGNQVRIQVGGRYTLQAQLKDDNFPPYEKVIPKPQKTSVTLETAGFLKALNRIAAVSSKADYMKMTINSSMELSVNSELGTTSVSIPLLKNYEKVLVTAVNQELMRTSIMTDAKRVTISTDGPLDPLVVTDESGRLAVVMPTRLKR